MNLWKLLSPRLVALSVVLGVCAAAALPALAADDQQTSGKIEPYDYQKNPIFLDEPETPPPASRVEKRVDSGKYPGDKTVRYEREIVRYSDNHFVADGFYREFYPNGQKFAEGQYTNGRQDGEWTYWYDNGKVNRKAKYKDGQPDGEWEVYNAEGEIIAKRGFKNGRRDGTWAVFDDTGKQQLRQEQYADGKADGVWKVWDPSGKQRTQMTFHAGTREGPAAEWDEKGNPRAEVNYKDGKLDGTATLYGPDGEKIVQQYKDGKLASESKSD
jgi:antitoxin component YwqK of YwqJK toxin-antitoxin module